MPRRTRPGDGRLTHDLDPQEKGPQDACGVFGVWAPGEDVAKLTYFGLYALQHRGQESAGIAVSNGRQILVYKDMGLVSQAFDESTLESLQGHLAIGHTRYSTTGASTWHNAQPTFRPTANGSIALAHNGNLTNTRDLAERVDNLASVGRRARHPRRGRATTSSPPTTPAWSPRCWPPTPTAPSRSPRSSCCPRVRGAFSFVFMDEHALYAARDPQGIRPLVLGRLENGWVVASEDAALATVGARVVREIEPGELVVIDDDGLRSTSSPSRPRRAASSSTSTSPAPTPPSPAAASTRPGWRWAAGSPRRTPSTPTWSSRCRSPAPPPRSATPRPAASPTARAS